MAGQGRATKRAFWRGAIQRQAESGLPVAKFCRREGLQPVTFYGWRRKLREESTASSGACVERRPVAGTPALVPVRLLEEPASAAVEIVSPGGWVLRVQAGAHTDHARRVLQLLQEVG